METSEMWQLLPVWNKEASTKMSSQRTSKSAIIQRNTIGKQQGGVSGGTTPLSTGTPSATQQDPLIATESNDNVSFLVVATTKMAPVDNTSNNSWMQTDNMVPYHKFSNHTDQLVHEKLREKNFALAKGYYQLVNELNHYKGRNSVQNSSIQGYQDSSISAALSERRSRLAKIEPSIVTKVVSFICFQDQEVLL